MHVARSNAPAIQQQITEENPSWWLDKIRQFGPALAAWARQLLGTLAHFRTSEEAASR